MGDWDIIMNSHHEEDYPKEFSATEQGSCKESIKITSLCCISVLNSTKSSWELSYTQATLWTVKLHLVLFYRSSTTLKVCYSRSLFLSTTIFEGHILHCLVKEHCISLLYNKWQVSFIYQSAMHLFKVVLFEDFSLQQYHHPPSIRSSFDVMLQPIFSCYNC